MSALTATGRSIVERMAAAPRGPERDGLFALWLVVRMVEDSSLDPPFAERAVRRRIELLTRRLGSLMVEPRLKRALTSALKTLDGAGPAEAAKVLQSIGPAVRSSYDEELAELLTRAGSQGKGAARAG